MSDHYFNTNPSSSHHEQTIHIKLLDKDFDFRTDSGVFSKDTVDFGSRVLIETFVDQTDVKENEQILELGSGYGPITLSLASNFPQTSITGIEINERAYELAEKNKLLNQLPNANFIKGDAINYQEKDIYHYCLTNPPIRAGKKTIQEMIRVGYDAIVSGGQLWVVIQKKQGAPSMEKYLQNLTGNVERIHREKGYWILRSFK
ncbi:class I SAM-dependent methyltransferase [Aerococcaceae bacterium DSM 111020]|nr:class I SAM-dependent methyltransferase [Aerococcaceae bacterium DSM 111020]